MFINIILLDVCLTSFLHGFLVSSCDENCPDKPVLTPSTLAVKFGGSASAKCSVCQHCQSRLFGLVTPVGQKEVNGTTISWKVDNMAEWDTTLICYYNDKESGRQCCSKLPITLYKPPEVVAISPLTEPMIEGLQYNLRCTIRDVAPLKNIIATFYRGNTPLGPQQSERSQERKPGDLIFDYYFTPSKEDDGGQFWCEARLQLGPEGPQPPPVVKSSNTTAVVYYKPQLSVSSHPDPITVTEGDRLVLNCLAEANPAPSYNWTLPSYVPSTFTGDIFTIKAVTSVDGGQYICSVCNSVGTASVTFDVNVCGVVCLDKPKFTPSTLVVKYGDPAGLQCSVCEHCQPKKTGFEIHVGRQTNNGTIISWEVDQMTEWDTTATCFYLVSGSNDQCCSELPIHLYQPPNSVRISSMADSPQMSEGHECTLQCFVDDVAPVEKLTVTFYRGHTQLGQVQSDKKEKKPVSETFNLNITLSKEDDGGEFWCEAKLELGPGGPQPPPVVKSPKYTATVHYMPQLKGSSRHNQIVISEGNSLQLNCSAVGNPSPSFTWTRPSNGLSNDDSVLTINSVTTEDSGQYICFVSNNQGNITVTFDVEVQRDYIPYVIAAIIGVVLVVLVAVILYVKYYKNH